MNLWRLVACLAVTATAAYAADAALPVAAPGDGASGAPQNVLAAQEGRVAASPAAEPGAWFLTTGGGAEGDLALPWHAGPQDGTPQEEVGNCRETRRPSSAADAIALGGPPATLFLMVQGLLWLGLIRGRRRWAAWALALVSLCRAGLDAVPRLLALPKSRQTVAASESPVAPGGVRVPAPERPSEVRFVGLLRRLDADPACPKQAGTAWARRIAAQRQPSVRPAATPDFFLGADLTSPPSFEHDGAGVSAFVCAEAPSLPLRIPAPLVARPPPFAA